MGFMRPATPGFIVTLVATILLVVVSFCVPFFKSVFFLKANISVSGITGNITFGTLGYCLELSNGTTCSKPSIGYQLDINSLVGNNLPIEIPQIAVKWITYALFLHVVALILAAGSAVFGLLAHVREMAMTCCSSCISGFAATVAMVAFIFDLALFFIAKSRINKVGSAQLGNAIWLTLAAWLLLFFSGCFYTLGRCCISSRGTRSGANSDWKNNRKLDPESSGGSNNGYAEQMRLDAVKAEADRKARQKVATEGGLPAFSETQPLTARVDGDAVYIDDPYNDNSTPHTPGGLTQGPGYAAGGYMRAPQGSRAVDEYYNQPSSTTGYPPQSPQLQGATYGFAQAPYGQNSSSTPPQRQNSGYSAAPVPHSQTAYGYGAPTATSPPPTNNYLNPTDRYGSPLQQYGHGVSGTSYHTASSSQGEDQAEGYSPYGYNTQTQYTNHAFNPDTYNNTGLLASPAVPVATAGSPSHQYGPERSYTLGGGGYGENSVPSLPEAEYNPYTNHPSTSPPLPIDTTNVGYASAPSQRSPVRGPRTQPLILPHDDSPPGYDSGSGNVTGHWGKQ